MKSLRVAAGILADGSGRVLLTERICDGPFNGLWEFPGGKIAAGESALQALTRELDEELGVEIGAAEHLVSVAHDYADRSVAIEFFLVRRWRYEPAGREGQRLKWVAIDALDAAELLPADLPVVNALKNL